MGRAVVARQAFPPQLFPLDGSVRDGCQYVAIEALCSAVKLGCASFHLPPLMAAETRDSLSSLTYDVP